MIYYYKIRIEYYSGSERILKDYIFNFAEVADFFIWLKKKHKDNFTLVSIKEWRGTGYPNKSIIGG